MGALKKVEQDEAVFTVTLTDIDYRQLKSFKNMLKSSIHAAEETLATAQNRYAIFSRMIERIEQENGIDNSLEK